MNGISVLMPCFGTADETFAQAAAIERCFPEQFWPDLQVVVPGPEQARCVSGALATRPGASVESIERRLEHPTDSLVQIALRGGRDAISLIPSGGPEIVRLASILVDRLSRFDVVFSKRRRGSVDKQRRRLLRAATLRWKPGLRDPDPGFWAARRDVVEAADAWKIDWLKSPWSLAARGVRVGEVRLPAFESTTAPAEAEATVIPWRTTRTNAAAAPEATSRRSA